jgi:hypothetical protein
MKRIASFISTAAIVIFGTAWMALATAHFERTTGREFYWLAGYHYSVPEWGFKYDVGGERSLAGRL